MKKIISFFTPKQEFNFIEKQKSKYLINISFFGILISLIFIVVSIINPSKNFLLNILSPSLLIILFVIILFLLKYTNSKLSGNIFSISLVAILAIVINIISPNVFIVYKFIGGFYVILGLFTAGAIFAKQNVILLNFAIIFATTTRIFLYGLKHSPEQADLLKTGYIEHTIALIITSLILYYVVKLTNSALEISNKNSEGKEEQNIFLVNLMDNIEKNSKELFETSNYLSTFSDQVNQGANEQAATTEEISASMEQMLSTITSNTYNSEQSHKTISETSKNIQKNNEILFNTIEQVNNISEKIKIISEISAKTDILSINAAIEAARAGDIGKGFAVVAQEIRKLADNSKTAAEEIKKISTEGNEMSEIAKLALERMVPEIMESAEIVEKIFLASKEQQSNAEAINSSIIQLSQISNQNAITAEILTNTSEQLSDKATQLKKLLDSYKK